MEKSGGDRADDVTMLEGDKSKDSPTREDADEGQPIADVSSDSVLILDVHDDESLATSVCEQPEDEEKIKSSLEQTLPPGAAPSGFQIVDEVYAEAETSRQPDENKPLLTITFRDHQIATRYKKKFMAFLNELILKSNENCVTQWKNFLVLEICGSLSKEKSETSVQHSTVRSSSTSHGQKQMDSLFVVDTMPALKDDLDVPTYGKKFDRILDKNSSTQKDNNEEKLLKFTCFNCMGNHNLKDCSEPKNQANINKNRKEFNARNVPRNVRYHQEDDQRFGHLVPGQMSKNLRRALNLKDNELPRHIYKMRELGYPPGWLEEAKLQHSGLSLFNSEGVAEREAGDEDTEVINVESKDQYDFKKFIDFPGFNVHPPRGTYDHCKQYWGSENQIKNSKIEMLTNLSGREIDDGYKKKKLKTNVPTIESKAETSEMEVEILDEEVSIEFVSANGLFIPPLPKDTARPPEPPPGDESDGQESMSPESTQGESTAPSSRADSPSLSDLEFAKKNILAELEDSNSQSTLDNSAKNSSLLDISSPGLEMLPPVSDSTPNTKANSKPNTPVSNRGEIKFIDLGTPILKSASPFNKLPSSEKFSKDICDVIYFENLPDATGTYEKMSGLIQKVRNKLSEINKE